MKQLICIFILLSAFTFFEVKAQTDTIPPVITLVGDPAAKVCRCTPYKDEGYVVTDNVDSAQYIKIDTSGTIITEGTNKQGIFTLRYKATDRAGNFSYSEWRYILTTSWEEYPCIYYEYDPCKGTNIEDFVRNNTIKLYPNPAQSELFIETNQLINTISIYNISGKKIFQETLNQNLNMPYKINTKHFPAGVYMVQLKSASGIINRKVEIRH